ncbi:MAG TPA: diguanylate cyclase [Leptospiraceae bacterium]|nr:diguanylate cyclase [Leptospiraceae bacterium]
MRLLRASLYLCIIFASAEMHSEDTPPDLLSFEGPSMHLAEYITVLEDREGLLTVNEIIKPENSYRFRKVESSKEAFNFSYSSSAYWLRLPLKNSGNRVRDCTLVISYPRLENIQLFFPDPKTGRYTVTHSGYSVPFQKRPYQSRFFVFPISVPEQFSDTLYLRIESANSLSIPIMLWDKNSYYRHELDDHVIQAMYFGTVAAMVLFNILLYFILRDINYIIYVLFVLSSGLTVAAYNGIAPEILWKNSPFLDKYSVSILFSSSLVIFLLFMRRMLSLKTLAPVLNLINSGLVFSLIIISFFLITSFRTFVKVSAVFHMTTAVWVLAVSIIFAARRHRNAYFFLAAFAVLFLIVIISSLRSLGFLPVNAFTASGPQIGSVTEMILLAFILADSCNLLRREKENAERQIKENLEKSNLELERKVRERTIALEKANEELSRLAILDGLTKIANRRRFDEYLNMEWKNHLREKSPITVILIDIDFFKLYNDCYGHQGGDECLKKTAETISGIPKRPGDLTARYGGEEFAVILPNTDSQGGFTVAETIRAAVISLAVPHLKSETESIVTLSLGVASVIPDKELTQEDLISMADRALYEAKHKGRNRTVVFKDNKA